MCGLPSVRRWALLALLFCAACSGGGGADAVGPVVTGKLTHNGQPLKDPGIGGLLQIQFWPAEAAPGQLVDATDAVYNYADGTFSVGGGSGRGIKPGRYKVHIQYWERYDAESPDKFNNAYTRDNTTIIREVKADGSPLEPIDLN